MSSRKRSIAVLVVTLLVAAASCGGDDDDDGAADTLTPGTDLPATDDTEAAETTAAGAGTTEPIDTTATTAGPTETTALPEPFERHVTVVDGKEIVYRGDPELELACMYADDEILVRIRPVGDEDPEDAQDRMRRELEAVLAADPFNVDVSANPLGAVEDVIDVEPNVELILAETGQEDEVFVDDVGRFTLPPGVDVDPLELAANFGGGDIAAPNYVFGFVQSRWILGPGGPPQAADPNDGKSVIPIEIAPTIGVMDSGVLAAGELPTLPDSGSIVPDDGSEAEIMTGGDAGHGTHIATMLRRLVPAATVVMVKAPFVDGVSLDFPLLPGEVTLTNWGEVATTASIGMDFEVAEALRTSFPPIDALSLSFGTYGCPQDVFEFGTEFEDFRTPIATGAALLDVRFRDNDPVPLVAAAAGNAGRDLKLYPAAFANHPLFSSIGDAECEGTRLSNWLVSVGSTDADGTTAAYSNHGCWVSIEAVGTDLVSFGVLDESPGWVSWSGTSFATPCAAARLLEQAASSSETWRALNAPLDCGMWLPPP